MMKSLYTGVSGLRIHQTRMDVIGNNIANVNTSGYKQQRATFRDMLYETVKSPNKAGEGFGGTNASQIGLGAKVGSIDTNHGIAAYSITDNPEDLYINGEGFFVVTNQDGDKMYTRLGTTSVDSENNLVDSSGLRLLGINISPTPDTATANADGDYPLDQLNPIKIDKSRYINIEYHSDGTVTGIDKTNPDYTIETIAQICVARVPNKNALVASGNSYYTLSQNTGNVVYEIPGKNGTGDILSGALELSNVDLAKEFTDMIITQRGYQANTKIISTADEMLQELVNLKR